MRVVNPVTPGLGGPQVNKAAGWLARTGIRFSGDGWRLALSLLNRARKSTGNEDGREIIGTTGSELRPVFFPQPFGTRIGSRRNDSLRREGPEGNRLICEGFDPGSE